MINIEDKEGAEVVFKTLHLRRKRKFAKEWGRVRCEGFSQELQGRFRRGDLNFLSDIGKRGE